MRLRRLSLALVLALAACSTDPTPTTTREAQFTVNPGPGDRQFDLVLLEAANASHEISQSLMAPYTFFMENATAPVQGIFLPNTAASLADVQLLFGGETVPRIVTQPSENSAGCPTDLPAGALCVNSGCPANLPPPCVAPQPAQPEVRFDVASVPVTLFSANVGSLNQDHLIATAQTPATIYLESPNENASGVFTKLDVNATLTATLYVDGIARDTATSPAGSSDDAVVRYQFAD